MKVSALNEGIPKSVKMVHFTSAEENKNINSEVNPSSNSLAKAIPVAVFLTMMPANGTPQQMESVLNQLNAKNTTELYSPQPEKDIDSVRFDDTLQQPKPKIGIFNAEFVLDHERFKVGDKTYTIYYNSMFKAYREADPPLITNIFVVADGYKPRFMFKGSDISPPRIVGVKYHNLGDPDNKDYITVILLWHHPGLWHHGRHAL